jgi:hypothetical protein
MVLIAYRHGLRASEIADREWSQVEFGQWVAKQGDEHEQGELRLRRIRERIGGQF